MNVIFALKVVWSVGRNYLRGHIVSLPGYACVPVESLHNYFRPNSNYYHDVSELANQKEE